MGQSWILAIEIAEEIGRVTEESGWRVKADGITVKIVVIIVVVIGGRTIKAKVVARISETVRIRVLEVVRLKKGVRGVWKAIKGNIEIIERSVWKRVIRVIEAEGIVRITEIGGILKVIIGDLKVEGRVGGT